MEAMDEYMRAASFPTRAQHVDGNATLSTYFAAAYQLALDLAGRAERAYWQ